MTPTRVTHINAQLATYGLTTAQIEQWWVQLGNRLLKELHPSQNIPLDENGHVGDLTGGQFYIVERTKIARVVADHGQQLDIIINRPNKRPERLQRSKADFVNSINLKEIELIELVKK
jgi:hypothetical protein